MRELGKGGVKKYFLFGKGARRADEGENRQGKFLGPRIKTLRGAASGNAAVQDNILFNTRVGPFVL